ncbi:MAG: hypothetical protein ABSA21_03340 [Candidatus Limnocylindrales bacterium]
MSADASRKIYGRIGGLTAWSRLDPEVMVGPAHRGFRARFERLVDAEGQLDPAERAKRIDRALRAHMLTLAAKSAEVRRQRRREMATTNRKAGAVR